jgi:acyl dehydratase
MFFIRGLGGFGFKGNGKSAIIPAIPKRAPDYVLKDSTYPSQAFVYRLCDDDNILHIDPEVAKKAGFERPIIHGIEFLT